MREHPVLAALRERLALGVGHLDRERAVVAYGQAFVGIERPKGFRRQRKAKACFQNASLLALDKRGTYVEGFAISQSPLPFPHAWVTLDGIHAIDPTLPNAPECHYFGIPFDRSVLRKAILAREYWGLLDPVDHELLQLR